MTDETDTDEAENGESKVSDIADDLQSARKKPDVPNPTEDIDGE